MNNDNKYLTQDKNNNEMKIIQHTIQTFNYISLVVQMIQFLHMQVVLFLF